MCFSIFINSPIHSGHNDKKDRVIHGLNYQDFFYIQLLSKSTEYTASLQIEIYGQYLQCFPGEDS